MIWRVICRWAIVRQVGTIAGGRPEAFYSPSQWLSLEGAAQDGTSFFWKAFVAFAHNDPEALSSLDLL